MSPHLLAAGTVMAAHVERSHRPDPDGCVRGDQRPFSRWLGRLRRPQWRGACEMGGRNAEEVVDDWENAEGKTPQSHCVIFCSPWPHSSFFLFFFLPFFHYQDILKCAIVEEGQGILFSPYSNIFASPRWVVQLQQLVVYFSRGLNWCIFRSLPSYPCRI